MKALKALMLILFSLFSITSCSDSDGDKYWLEATDEAPVAIQSCQGKVVYSDVLNCWAIVPEQESICGTYYIVKDKKDNFWESYKNKTIVFSGTAQKAKLCHDEKDESTGVASTDYFFLELEEIAEFNKNSAQVK